MKLMGEIYKPDVAFIPVGDRFTMGPELGAKAAEMIKPRVAIPIHYGTWPLLVSDISAFTPKGVEVQVVEPGESWIY
jgi:L-ascorbate metabolism protein UlaG (beta-lactamase superfamily)